MTDPRYIKHYGKKGMKWGVITEEDSIGDPQHFERLKSQNGRFLKEHPNANLADFSKAEDKKLSDLSEDEVKKEKRKKLLIGAGVLAGVAVVGVALYLNRDKVVQAYYEKIKSLGYNDAGNLAKTPMILLDKTLFKVDAIKELSVEDIQAAANSIVPMANETFRAARKACLDMGPMAAIYFDAYRI